MKDDAIYIVLPCYREEEVIEHSAGVLLDIFKKLINEGRISDKSRLLFVDDGSDDKTWEKICGLHAKYKLIEGIRLSKNKGHQVALYAGIKTAVEYADAIISMDVDLQQDVGAISEFIESYENGHDIVYGIRNDRHSDSYLKKTSALMYYKIMKLVGTDIVENSADYRLLSKRSALALLQYKESNLFIRGLIPSMGFNVDKVYFDVKEREIGESKYTLRKMIKLAMDGITSFSIAPIRLILLIGVFVLILSVIVIVHGFIVWMCGDTVPGWASLEASIWFLGGVQLIGIGVIGEYIGRTYMESKHRPRFFIQDSTLSEKDEKDRSYNSR